MRTFKESPSGDDAFGANSSRCAGQTDRLNIVVVCQWRWQFYHGNVIVTALVIEALMCDD